MSTAPKPIQIFFSRLFAKVMLQNKIVATIVQQIGLKVRDAKDRVDITINNDI